jgi:murein DD-endopeptidase MepM/ murein hydrolase activator NlpD
VVTKKDGSLPEGQRPREAARLSIALALLALAALGSSLAAGFPEPGEGAWHLLSPDPVLESGPLGSSAPVTAKATSPAYQLLGGLQPLDAAIHLAGLDTRTDTFPDPDLWESETERSTGRVYLDLATVLRRGAAHFTWRTVEDSAQAERDRLAATPSLFPTRGYISSGFTRNRRHPILDLTREHKGLDIVAPTGTPIVAAARGRVRFVGEHVEYGRLVEIDHGYGVVTRYAHASRTLVRRGQLVARGDTIARVGRTGLAIGSHLHYEVLVNGVAANPNRYVFDLNVIPD